MSACVIVHVCGSIRVQIPVWLWHTGTLFNSSPLPSARVWLQPIQSWATCTERESERESKRKIGQPLWCTLVVLVTASLFAWSPNSPSVALRLMHDPATKLIPVDVFKWKRLAFLLPNFLFFYLIFWHFLWIHERAETVWTSIVLALRTVWIHLFSGERVFVVCTNFQKQQHLRRWWRATATPFWALPNKTRKVWNVITNCTEKTLFSETNYLRFL